jgi:hypothetical protein
MTSTIFCWSPADQFAPNVVAICCPNCEYALTLHQPDPTLPDRLLATCDECKSWYLANSDGTVLKLLPGLHDDTVPSITAG